MTREMRSDCPGISPTTLYSRNHGEDRTSGLDITLPLSHPARFEQIGGKWSSTLIISPVIESDTGDYECWARQRTSSGKEVKNILKVLIEPRRGNCQPGQYQCEGGDSQKQYCIATR